MTFATPLAFLLLLLLPLFIEDGTFLRFLAKLKGSKSSKKKNSFSSISHVFSGKHSSLPASPRAKLRHPFLSIIAILAFSSLVIALARPQYGSSYTEIEASGRDIMLVLDISRSMQALDFFVGNQRVNRLTALKKVVRDFVSKRRGDRIGLVVFGDHAFTQCPLTLDHQVLDDFIKELQIGMAGSGTAIGSALAISLKRLKQIDSESKVIVLVTDGKSNSGKLSPTEAAKIAEKLNIKVYTVGIGGPGVAPFPSQSFFGRSHLQNQQMEFDEETLQEIASVTNAKYFRADDLKALKNIYQEIDKIEERTEKENSWVAWQDYFSPFLTAGLLLLSLYIFLQSSIFLRVP